MIVKASMNSKRDLRDDIRIEALRGDVGRIPGAEVMVDERASLCGGWIEFDAGWILAPI